MFGLSAAFFVASLRVDDKPVAGLFRRGLDPCRRLPTAHRMMASAAALDVPWAAPIGWSTGFITMPPRSDGTPRHSFAGLPELLSCSSTLPNLADLAMHFTWTRGVPGRNLTNRSRLRGLFMRNWTPRCLICPPRPAALRHCESSRRSGISSGHGIPTLVSSPGPLLTCCTLGPADRGFSFAFRY